MEVICNCPLCHREHSVFVSEEGYMNWQYMGMLAQEAFPELSPTEREQLISGFCPDCQKSIFG